MVGAQYKSVTLRDLGGAVVGDYSLVDMLDVQYKSVRGKELFIDNY